MRTISTLIILFVGFQTFAQNDSIAFKKLLNKVMTTQKNNPSYQLTIDYTLYRTHKKDHVQEHYKGIMAKKETASYAKIAHTEYIQLPNDYIKINHGEKAMLYAKANSKTELDPTDVSIFLKNFKDHKVSKKGTQHVCEVRTQDISVMPYDKVILYINEDFTLASQEIYFTTKAAYQNQQGVTQYATPCLKVSMTKPSKVKDQGVFDKSRYVTIKNNKIYPSKQYEGYEIIAATN